MSYQTEGPKDRQTLDVGQPQLHQAESDDDAVKNVPANLKVVIRIHGYKLENHLSCEDPSENLKRKTPK